jgi:glutaredoxin
MKLELFKKDTCPFCQRVMQYIDQSGRNDVEYHDIINSEPDHERLIVEGGQDMVPCLFIDGTPMYESSDIIRWLQDNPE